MNKMGTIIGFTFKNKVKTKSFLVTTLILMVLITVGMNVPYMIKLFQGDDASGNGIQIGVIAEENNELAGMLKAYVQPETDELDQVTVQVYPSADDPGLKKAMDEGTTEGYVTFAEPAGEGVPPVTYYSNNGEMNGSVRIFLQNALQQANTQLIVGDKLTQEQVTAMFAPVQINTQQLVTGGNDAEAEKTIPVIDYVVVYVLLFLFFMSIFMTGNMIAAEVTAEKSSRIMEILITSASPLSQMFGKVIGIFLVGMLQIAAIVLTVAVNLMLPHNSTVMADFDIDLSQLNISLLVYGLVLYVLGYFLYAILYAAVGSIVSRTEELGQATMPIMMLGLVAFYIPMFSLGNADTMLVKVASFIPLTSPLSLLLRIGVGEIALWEILLSLGLLLVAILCFGWLAAKIYRTGVLMYGKRPTIKEIRKAMKAYKI